MTHSAKKMIGRKAERPGKHDSQSDSARPKTFLLTSFLLGTAEALAVVPTGKTTAIDRVVVQLTGGFVPAGQIYGWRICKKKN